MEVNIFDKIYQIMTTYENLLKQKRNTPSTNSFDVKNDPFFQFIFQNIHLSKPSSTFHSASFQQENKKNSEQNEKSLHEKSLLSKNNDINETLKNNVETNTKKEEKKHKFEQKIDHDQDTKNKKNQSNIHENKHFSSKNKDNSFHHPEINEVETSTINEVNSEVKKYMKLCYKKVILLCHPDKTKENKKLYQEYFIKSQEYYENNFIIGLLYLFYLLKLKPPSLSSLIVNHIIIEIRQLQEKINELKN